MKAEAIWGMRWKNCANPLAHRIMEVATKKKTLVCLAADMTSISELIDLVKDVGPYLKIGNLQTLVKYLNNKWRVFMISDHGQIL
jgi:hypothetical protein